MDIYITYILLPVLIFEIQVFDDFREQAMDMAASHIYQGRRRFGCSWCICTRKIWATGACTPLQKGSGVINWFKGKSLAQTENMQKLLLIINTLQYTLRKKDTYP